MSYINLEIGSVIKFRELLGGVKAYGIDYRIIQYPNTYPDNEFGQFYFPLFMVTSITKNLDSVSIECMQLHALFGGVGDVFGDEGYFNDNQEGDLFYFPDAEPVVVDPYLFAPDVETEEYVETNNVLETDFAYVLVGNYTYLRSSSIDSLYYYEYWDGNPNVDSDDAIFSTQSQVIQIKSLTHATIAMANIVFPIIQGTNRIALEYISGDSLDNYGIEGGGEAEDGQILSTLKITRMEEVVRVAPSTVFNDKVKDLANIRDIKKW